MSLSVRSFSRFVFRRLPKRSGRSPTRDSSAVGAAPKRRWPRGMVWGVGLASAFVLYAGPGLVTEVVDRSYIGFLEFPVDSVKKAALEELAERRPERAVVPLINLFRGRGRLAVQSSDALVEFAEIAVPALTEAASDSDSRVRYWAVRTLGKIGRRAEASAEVLAGALRDPVAVVRHNALTALPEVDGEAAVAAITDFLSFEEAEPVGRIVAIQVLENLGPKAERALPALEELIRKVDHADVKECAVQAVRTLRSAREI